MSDFGVKSLIRVHLWPLLLLEGTMDYEVTNFLGNETLNAERIFIGDPFTKSDVFGQGNTLPSRIGTTL